MKFKLTDVVSNPFRDLRSFPLEPERVQKLVEDIKAGGFDSNVLGRKRDGKLELAYGHHRLAALRQLQYEDAEFIVKDLSDDEMLQKMSSDNDPAYSHGIEAVVECVRAAVLAFAEDRVKLADIDKRTKREYIRYAPSFISRMPHSAHAYTAASVAEKLQLTEADGQDRKRAKVSVHAALAFLENRDLGLIPPDWMIKGMSADSLLRDMTAIYDRAAKGLVTARVNTMTATAAVVEGQRQLDAQAAVFKAKQAAEAEKIRQMAERVADADLKEMEEKRAAYRAKQVKEKIRVKAFAKERRELEERLKKRKEDAEAARKAEAKIVKAAAVQAAKDPQPFWPELTELLVHLEAGLPKCAATVLKDKGRLTAGQKKTLDEALGKARMAIAVFRTKSMN